MPIKAKILTSHQLSDIKNLSGMMREMLYHLIHGFEHRCVATLDGFWLRQPFGRDLFDYTGGFLDDAVQRMFQFFGFGIIACSKLCIALPDIGRSANAGNNPLPDISAEVQYEVPDGILSFRFPPPDLIVRKLAEAQPDPILVPAQHSY
jgi:hypothetical protein